MQQKPDITGLILAGGAGRRVEGRDKGLISWQGKPLVAHVHDCLKPQVSNLFISCNRNFSYYETFSNRVIADSRHDFQGPLAGIEAASDFITTDLLVVVACDMPNLPTDLVTRLIAPLSGSEEETPDISYAHDGDRAQYLCAAIRRHCLTSLSQYLDEGYRAVRGWYNTRHTIAVDFSDCKSQFGNYNRLE